MKIKGKKGSSLLNYPGVLSSILFFGGCNLKCPYCHNPELARNSSLLPGETVDDTLAWLQRRRGFDDGVVITGGEPTLLPYPALFDLIEQIKGMGFKVKLDTNGLRPEVIEGLLDAALLDTVALDLKTDPRRYGELGGPGEAPSLLNETLQAIKASGVEYEVRTTCAPGLVEEADIRAMGEFMGGCRKWVLQQFVPGNTLCASYRDTVPHPAATLKRLAELARLYAVEVETRGV